jgi:hypothetical protein
MLLPALAAPAGEGRVGASSWGALAAQEVRGEVRDEGGGAVAGALVALLADGRQVAVTLSDERGAFRVRAPAPGRYAIRVMRIGFRSLTTDPVALAAGEVVERPIIAPHVAVRLDAVEVRAARTCALAADASSAAAMLWEEARKALHATAWVEGERAFEVRLSHYERGLDKRARSVEWEHSWDEYAHIVRNPFASAPIEELAAHGYARRDPMDSVTWVYNAPDANVLLSDAFLRDHCFHVRRGEGPDSALIGLAFEPARSRRLPDVEGVLWLDRATAELRRLEYTYTRLPRPTPPGRAGGRLEFERLPSGEWLVRRWRIRMPVLVLRPRPGRDPGVPGGALVRQSPGDAEVFVGFKERGAEVLRTYGMREPGAGAVAGGAGEGEDSPAVAPSPAPAEREARVVAACPGGGDAAIGGTVTQTGTATPIAGARVYAAWTDTAAAPSGRRAAARHGVVRSVSVLTDAAGSWVLCGVPVHAAIFLRAEVVGTVSDLVELAAGRSAPTVRDLTLAVEGQASTP